MACIVASYVLSIVQLHPTNLFGLTGDDGIYFASAKALAEGKGYVLPNLPGSPPATKYPVFYPWMLSFVWRLNPLFPANLPLAISISIAFGVGFLLATYELLASLGGLGRTEALVLTAYLGLHPLAIFFGASVLSEMPFAFFALTSLIVADRAMRPKGTQIWSMCSGILAGMSVLARILGLPVVLGIFVGGALRRSWRQLLPFSLSAAPFVGAAVWGAIVAKKPASPIMGAVGSSAGWLHTWTFYTDYTGIWKLGVPNQSVFWAMLRNNLGMILRQPADLILGPTFVRDTTLGRIFVLIAAVATVAGILRQGKEWGWKPIHIALALYSPVLLLWNYPDMERFFLPFWPLMVAGAWIEAKRVLQIVKSSISNSSQFYETGLGLTVGFVVVTFAFMAAENLIGGTRAVVKRTSKERQTLLRDKEECYRWIRENTTPQARLVAYEDASTYLYTARETVRPTVFTTDEFYETNRLTQEASHLTDVAEAIGADYWLFSSDDYNRDWPAATALERSQLGRLENGLTLVFRGSGASATVRSAMCLKRRRGPGLSSCKDSTAWLPLVGDGGKVSAVRR